MASRHHATAGGAAPAKAGGGGFAPPAVRRAPAGSGLLQRFLRRYARDEAAAVAPFVAGRRVLDLGAGEAYVAVDLSRRTGACVCSVDVGPFRRTSAPYVVYDGVHLPFGDDAFDVTLLLLALHHCAAPEVVLDEAVRVTRHRVLVVESASRNRRDRFWLTLLDGRINAYRHEGRMPVAQAFRTPDEWAALFASRGLRTMDVRWLGAWWERLVHHPVLYVLEKRRQGRASARTA
jgi:SAM-dependent methyltransferase